MRPRSSAIQHILFYRICLSGTMYKNIHQYITSIHMMHTSMQFTSHQIRRLQENGPLFLKSWQKLHFCEVPTFSHRSRQIWVWKCCDQPLIHLSFPGEYRNLLEGTKEKWESWLEKHSVMFSACSPVAVGVLKSMRFRSWSC